MRFIYINSENLYPPDTHLIQGLRELGYDLIEITEKKDSVSYRRLLGQLKKVVQKEDVVIVGYPSPVLAICARFTVKNKIFFNALSSQYEANVISRGESGPLFLWGIKSWIIDFLSFHLSTKVLLESDAQREFVSSNFFISKKNLVRSFSGLDEKNFFYENNVKKLDVFTVLFRGRFLPESGILTIIETTKKLEDTGVVVRIIGAGFMYREVNDLLAKLKPKNLEMINKTLSFGDLRTKMQECHISLGQLACHPRLERTLPCKLFESLALGLPYLTGRNKAVFEILEENKNCIVVNQGDSDDLARKILELKDNKEILDRIGKAGYDLYKQKLTSKKLAEKVIEDCFI